MSLAHRQLINIAKKLGYKTDSGGICYGLAVMGMQAVLANDYKSFESRIKYLQSSEFEKSLASEIDKRTLYIEAKHKLQDKLGVINKQDEKEFSKLLKDKKETPDVINYLAQIKQWDKYKQDPQFIDAHAFIEGMMIYFSPQDFPDIFEKKIAPRYQDVDLTFARGLPSALIEKVEKKDDKTGKAYYEEKSRIEKATAFSGAYESGQLKSLFELIQANPQRMMPPPVFLISSIGHTISITYYPEKKEWMIINADTLPHKIIKDEDPRMMALKMSKEVLDAFHTKKAVITAEIYTTKNQVEVTKKWVGNLYTPADGTLVNISLTKLNEMDKNKIEIKDYKGASWLHVAAMLGDLETVQKLIDVHKCNPNLESSQGITAFQLAAQMGHESVVKYLCSLKNIEYDVNSLLKIDSIKSRSNIVMLLCNNQKKYAKFMNNDLLIDLIEKGDSANIKLLLENKYNIIDVNKLMENGWSPCVLAIKSGNKDIINLLIDKELINYNKKNSAGLDCIDIAPAHLEPEILIKLMSKKIEVIDQSVPEQKAAIHVMKEYVTNSDRNRISVDKVKETYDQFMKLNNLIKEVIKISGGNKDIVNICNKACSTYAKGGQIDTTMKKLIVDLDEEANKVKSSEAARTIKLFRSAYGQALAKTLEPYKSINEFKKTTDSPTPASPK